MGRKFQGGVWAGDKYLEVLVIWMIFKAKKLGEITEKVNSDRRELQRTKSRDYDVWGPRQAP